jgi:hypothetical protein
MPCDTVASRARAGESAGRERADCEIFNRVFALITDAARREGRAMAANASLLQNRSVICLILSNGF